MIMETILGLQTIPTLKNETYVAGWPYFYFYGRVYWSIVVTIVAISIAANTLQFVLMCDPRLRTLSYSVYLKFLSVSDSLVLCGLVLEESDAQFEILSPLQTDSAFYKIFNSFRFSTKLLSPWLLVGLTVDRYVCICHPLVRARFCTRKKAAVICSCLVAISVALIIPVLTELNYVTSKRIVSNELEFYLICLRLVASSIVPCVVIFALNASIVFRIKRGYRFRNAFVRTDCIVQKRDSSTRPLILVSVMAVVTLLPISVAESTDGVLRETNTNEAAQKLGQRLWPIWNLIYMLNFGQNFFILIGSAANYRNIMLAKLSCFVTVRNARGRTERQTPETDRGIGEEASTPGIPLPTVSAGLIQSTLM